MDELILTKKLKGKHTIETIAEILGVKINTAVNIVSKLKKKGYVIASGGGRQKRIYTISPVKQTKPGKGMFSILNKYSKIKIIPKVKHEVHGKYCVEDALIDLIKLNDFRILLGCLRLFNHITKWGYLHAKANNIETVIGMLYDCARTAIKTKKMPKNIYNSLLNKRTKRKIILFKGLKTNLTGLKIIEKRWNVQVPFSEKDLGDIK